jgi:hypothetical protein
MISIPSIAKPVMQLPKLTTPDATQLAAKFQPQPGAQALLKPGQSSSEYIQALQDNNQSTDAVNALAHGMPEQDSVNWACQSSEQVGDKLSPADHSALTAAQDWVKNPTPSTQAAAAAAAAQTDYTGPGAWAAQAAAWSKGPAAAVPAATAPAATAPAASAPAAAAPGVATPNLTAAAVAGSVLLAAGLVNRGPMPAMAAPKTTMPTAELPPLQPTALEAPALQSPTIPPVDQGQLAKMLNPFIDLGKKVAGGTSVPA